MHGHVNVKKSNIKPTITKSEANPTRLSSTVCVRLVTVNAVLLLETATQPVADQEKMAFLGLAGPDSPA
jgi:hypothetical protein